MARRMKKTEAVALFWLAVVAVPVALFVKFVETVGWPVVIGIAGLIIAGILMFRFSAEKQRQAERAARRARLLQKYGDEEVVQLMMQGSVWEGQTAEQLIDSIGKPEDLDQKVLKTKKKEVWKYHHEGANRYGLRVTLDNDVVVGWNKRN